MLSEHDLQDARVYAGKLISIEGVDTAGKSTQADLLVKALEEQEVKVIRLHFPAYGSPIGAFIKQLLSVNSDTGKNVLSMDAMQMLFVADQIAQQGLLRHYLEEDYTVVLDRYDLSTLAYYATERSIGESMGLVYDCWQSRLLRPDLTFVLDLPAEEVAKRKEELDRFEENPAFLAKAREAYEWLAENLSDRKVILIDALKSVDGIQGEILEGVQELRKGDEVWA